MTITDRTTDDIVSETRGAPAEPASRVEMDESIRLITDNAKRIMTWEYTEMLSPLSRRSQYRLMSAEIQSSCSSVLTNVTLTFLTRVWITPTKSRKSETFIDKSGTRPAASALD